MFHYSTNPFISLILLVVDGSPHQGSSSPTRSSMFSWHEEEGAQNAEGTGQDAGPAKPKMKAGKSNARPTPCQMPCWHLPSHTGGPQSTLARCATTTSSSVARSVEQLRTAF